MTLQHVVYTVEDHVATVRLDRPDHLNAFTDIMEAELVECLDRADADDDVQVIVLTGSGRAFCAGMDLSESPPEDVFEDWRSSASAPAGTQYEWEVDDLPFRRDGGGRVVLRMFDCGKPIIAAVNGHAVGVGITMTLAADLRIGAVGAKFAFPFTRRAFVPESCSSWFLPRVVPVQKAMEWMLTGRTVTTEEGLAAGLFLSLHPGDEVLDVAYGIAREIVEHTSPVTVAISRRLMWRMLGAAHPMEAHRIESHGLNLRGVSADAREGVAAFVQKRRPTFTDRVSQDLPPVLDGLPAPSYQPPGSRADD